VNYLRRVLPLLFAVILLGLAAVLGLLAVDVRAWQGRVTRDDLVFRTHRSQLGLWRTPAVLPGDPARSLLGADDAVLYRQALQFFWISRVGGTTAGQPDLAAERVVAEERLQGILATGATRAERSTAANLLGVMTITTPAADSATQKETLQRAKLYFTQAVREDPGNTAAKINLELVLRIGNPIKAQLDQDARGGFGSGGANGIGAVGGGY
jgi:hypothetical protein